MLCPHSCPQAPAYGCGARDARAGAEVLTKRRSRPLPGGLKAAEVARAARAWAVLSRASMAILAQHRSPARSLTSRSPSSRSPASCRRTNASTERPYRARPHGLGLRGTHPSSSSTIGVPGPARSSLWPGLVLSVMWAPDGTKSSSAANRGHHRLGATPRGGPLRAATRPRRRRASSHVPGQSARAAARPRLRR